MTKDIKMKILLTLIFLLLSSNAHALYEDQKRNEELFRQTNEMRRINTINDLYSTEYLRKSY